jgi:hypothetical protein
MPPCGLVDVVAHGAEQFEGAAGHGLIRRHVSHILLSIGGSGPDGVNRARDGVPGHLAGNQPVDQRTVLLERGLRGVNSKQNQADETRTGPSSKAMKLQYAMAAGCNPRSRRTAPGTASLAVR